MRAAEAVASGQIIWGHIVVTVVTTWRTEYWTVLVRDGSHGISLSAKMVMLDSSELLSQPHGEDANW